MQECIEKVTGYKGYDIAIRRWRPSGIPTAQLLMLHGVVSHSEWLAPIAARLANDGVDVLCPDRRGIGLNAVAPGDAPNKRALLEDVLAIQKRFARPDLPTDLAGFCWGGTAAICTAEIQPERFRSLILLAPSVFPVQDIGAQELALGTSSAPTETPLVPIDRFTQGSQYTDYIVPDPLRTRAVSPRFNQIMADMQSMLGPRWLKLTIPTLVVLTDRDRLSDNDKHERAFQALRSKGKQLVFVPGEHGLQFDAPTESADAIAAWLRDLVPST